ncbi:MAG: B3/B4 domain-containing protein, partial [Candidatus Odinarchaeia archaeon]
MASGIILWDKNIREKYPGLYVKKTILKNIDNTGNDNALSQIKEDIITRIKTNYTLENLKTDYVIRCYRDFYWRIKIDPTKIRPAGEALVRRILASKPFPNISPAVNAYNLSSVESFIALSGYDLDKLELPLRIRFSTTDDFFKGIGTDKPKQLSGNEIIVADKNKIICIYPYRDSEYSMIDKTTKNILILGYGVPGLSEENVENAVIKAAQYVNKVCGGEIEML